ncbi:hypothetical protein BGZ63DRAFT_478631 [Mariannaea sp. PMI_226]|nr:hypothetical protein BGZ63DRAFT_478631 [Mariannaea sp. PMI_226]
MWFQNPFAFRPGPVTFWTTAIYLAIIIPLIYVHESVPSAPTNRSQYRALNLSEAFLDLQNVTSAFHPYNSHDNDRVRDFYIHRVKEILDRNGMKYTTDQSGGVPWHDKRALASLSRNKPQSPRSVSDSDIVLFDDQISNATWASFREVVIPDGDNSWQYHKFRTGTYFEGNNFYVYIRGQDDPKGDWWHTSSYDFKGEGGVLVNCHIDSVSTGFGATDDGVGCVSLLQILSYFTSEGNQPKNGIVLLFNNAEEDGLLGAMAFGYSPLLPFLYTFVNLEGAGAGGRAILFRTTDLLAAKAYSNSLHPFGSIVADNAFSAGMIKSRTDFEIWHESYGQRGLDIAFYEPRARYHTNQDDTRHTSVDSIWHMLSAALATTKVLSESTGRAFHGQPSGRSPSKNLVNVPYNGKETPGVWFDLFGSAWVAFPLRGLFAWSLCLLVAAPMILFVVTYLLGYNDKYYFFTRDIKTHQDINDDTVILGGWKGFFRFPLALVFASGLTMGFILLLGKFNPLIVYGNSYSVFAMAISIFYFSFWLIMRGSSFVRPSALHRGYVIMWLFILGWAMQVVAAVMEDRMHFGFLYPLSFFQSAIFLALLISLLEQFALLGRHDFALQLHDAHLATDSAPSNARETEPPHTEEEAGDDTEEAADTPEETPTEVTPLRAGETGYGSNTTSFANTYRRRSAAENTPARPDLRTFQPFNHEQSWSGRLPSWTWIIQFLLLAPIPCILFGNLSLIAMSALNNTGTDGGKLGLPVLALGAMSIILLLPITPFIHRVTHHVPLFLLCVFVGTLIFNLASFPFSPNYRFKFYFQQKINIDDGSNKVIITGLEDYARQVISTLPVASNQQAECGPSVRRGLVDCEFDASALSPKLVEGKSFDELISLTILEKDASTGDVTIQINAVDSRVCYLNFLEPIQSFKVEGSASMDPRFNSRNDKPTSGFEQVWLWRRDRNQPWNVTIYAGNSASERKSNNQDTVIAETFGDGELKARAAVESVKTVPSEITVTCLWSDANIQGTIPALDDFLRYMPTWAAVTKRDVGLVEVQRSYKV